MAKRLKYNSDYMSDKMDSYLEQIEGKLSALYADASKEMQVKLAEFTAGYEKQKANMEARVEAGKMTQEEYSQWLNRHIVQSNEYKSTIDSLTTMAVNTDVAAMAMVNGAMPMVVAQSYNFAEALGFEAAQQAGLTQGTFQVYNARSVQALIRDNPNLLKEVDMDEDEKWNREKMNREISQGIIQGESMEKIADRLQKVTNMDRNAAVRNARTMMTGAENMGRAEAADDLKAQGIPMDEVWSATYDNRTRESHLELDGTVRDENGLFGVGIINKPLRYPADPEGDPEEIYNCRCRMSLQLKGVDHSKDQELYENFMKENFPQTWETMQEKDSIKNALDTYSKKQEEISARATKEIIPAPEKISLGEEKKIEDKIEIPEHPVRPRMKDYMDEDGYVDYDRLESARSEYSKQMEEYNRIKDDYIKRYEETPSMTMPEFNKWCEDNNVDILPSGLETFIGGTADVSEMDGRILTMATERCEELFSQFPYVLDYRQDFMERMGEEGTFHFSIGFAPKEQFVAEAGNGLVFGNNGGNIAEMAREHFEMVSTNGLVGGSGSLTSIIDHEFGHNVEDAIIEKNGLNRFEFEAECGRRLKGLEGASEYSTTKDTERFAEAFSAYVGGEDTPFAREMEKILKEQGMI